MSKAKIIGWSISALLAAFLILGSARGKFSAEDGSEMLTHIGYSADTIFKIGIVEAVIAILFLIPQTAFVGAILLTAYFGGAVATHVRVGDPFIAPIVFAIVIWVAMGLRQPAIFKLALGASSAPEPVTQD